MANILKRHSLMKNKYAPSLNRLRGKKYVTYRRLWLDACLSPFASDMGDTVLDLSGKRNNKRGSFSPPEQQSQVWWYVNLDMNTHPHIFANVARMPLPNTYVDTVSFVLRL